MHLLTQHGYFLCADPASGELLLRPLVDVTDAQLAALELPDTDWRGQDFDRFLADAGTTRSVPIPTGPLAGAELVFAPGRTFAIRRATGYLSPHPYAYFAPDAPAPGGWERFAAVSAQDYATLRRLHANDWVARGSGRIVRADQMRIGGNFCLHAGTVDYDLRGSLPFVARDPRYAVTVVREGWRLDELCLYRPLVFFVAFRKPEVLGQLYLALRSLVTYGGYHGRVHVITDQSAESILAQVPALDPAQLSVQSSPAADWVGYVAAKYTIADWPEAEQFQPLLFCDADIIFDAPIEPMLTRIATLRRIAAPLEDYSPLATAPSVGATLIQRDGLDPRLAAGFNGGTLGIPNLPAHRQELRLIRQLVENYLELNGRTSLRWVDQEFANYVGFREGSFDTHSISRYVRTAWPEDVERGHPRVGLIHFWPQLSSAHKLETMKRYIAWLDAQP
jgi:hypothetical protein